MNANDLLDIIGQTPERYILDAGEKKAEGTAPQTRRPGNKLLLIAAIVAVMLFLMGCAVVLLSLDDLSMGTKDVDVHIDYNNSVTEERTVLSLQGYAGTPGYQASLEWHEFLETYDPDGEILMSVDKRNTGIPVEYISYTCYTQEMKDKVDEICQKYGLNILGKSYEEADIQTFFAALGIPGIIANDIQTEVSLLPGYYYPDGTFQLDGSLKMTGEGAPWGYRVEFQFRCVMKNSFDQVTLTVEDTESFDQWTYTLPDGTEVLLALSSEKALLVADKDDYFVTVNILNSRVGDVLNGEQMMDRAALEAFADTFDLTFQPQKPDVAAAEAREEARYQEYLEWMEQQKAEDYEYYGVASYAERIRYSIEEEWDSERFGYVLIDLDGDGVSELLVGQDGYFKHLYTMDGDETVALIDGNVFPDSYYYLCEGNVIAKVIEDSTWQFGRVEGTHIIWELGVKYNEYAYPEEPYRKVTWDVWRETANEPITQEEYKNIIASYQRIVVDTKPLSEYPQEKEVARDPDKRFMYALYADYEQMLRIRLDSEAYEEYTYALVDLDGNGQQELIYREPHATTVYTMVDGKLCSVFWGFELVICEDNILRDTVRYSDDSYAVCYYRVVYGGQVEMVEYLRYDRDRDHNNPWFRSSDASGFDSSLIAISQGEFNKVMAYYSDSEVEMRPITEYPFS